MGDFFTQVFGVDKDGLIIIPDAGNKRISIYNIDGQLRNTLLKPSALPDIDNLRKWPTNFVLYPGGNSFAIDCDYQKMDNGRKPLKVCFIDYNNNVLAKVDLAEIFPISTGYVLHNYKTNTYGIYSPTGQLIKTSPTKPPELGKLYTQGMGNGQYQTSVVYPDMTYQMTTPFDAEKYYRDKNNNVYFIIGYTATLKEAATDADEDISVTTYDVHKYNSCGKKLGTLSLRPLQGLNANGDVEYEYGEPLVAYNGDIYTWRRNDDKYSIIKWTWVDDPNQPSGPDAPTNLAVAASTTGLYLTWTASPQDPGCVTGYEISRSDTSGGTFSVITTADKGVLNYNDTTAVIGTTYYYKLRAKSGTDFSAYTNEASGQRQ